MKTWFVRPRVRARRMSTAAAAGSLALVVLAAFPGTSPSAPGASYNPQRDGFRTTSARPALSIPNLAALPGKAYAAAHEPSSPLASAANDLATHTGSLAAAPPEIAARSQAQGYPDPVGDNQGLAPDLRAIAVVDDPSGLLGFGIAYANRICAREGDFIAIFLDVDQNLATGNPGTGADYAIALDGTSNSVGVLKWTGIQFTFVPSSLRGRCVSTETPPFDLLVVNRSDIGVGSSFRFIVGSIYTEGDQAYFDFAGPFTYTLGSGGSAPPPPAPPLPPSGKPSPAGPPPTVWCGDAASAAQDRPAAAAGNQVHVIYAIPSDGPDRFSDRVLPIAVDIAAIDSWWYREAGRAPRFDLFDQPSCAAQFGRLDVTRVRLNLDSNTLMPLGVSQLVAMRSSLQSLGFTDSTKKYLVYYDGPVSPDVPFCGVSPNVPGNVGGTMSFVILNVSPDPSACGTVGRNDYMALTAAHELLHNLGAVQPEAPHSCPDSGHVCGDPYDIMSPGDGSETYDALDGARLDPGNDDYYGHSGSWWDVQDSAWLSTAAPAAHPSAAAHLTIGGVVARPLQPHAGRLFRLTVKSHWDGTGHPQLSCHGTIQQKTVRVARSTWQPMSCAWAIPARTAGGTLVISIRARIGNTPWLTRTARYRISP